MRTLVFAALISSTALIPAAAMAQQKNQQNQQAQQGRTDQQNQTGGDQQRQIRAVELVSMPVMTDDNQRAGAVAGVVERDQQQYVVVETAKDRQMVMVEMDKVRLQANRLVISKADLSSGEPWQENMQATYTPVPEQDTIRLAGAGQQQPRQQDASQQNAQRAQGSQSAQAGQDAQGAQITVEQQPAQVSINQQPPQIIVRQPPPTIIVQQAQPEIIVRMPEPQVQVSQDQPQVQVQQPKPRVETQHAQEALVKTQQAEPQVTFERTGEPQIQFQEEQGQPKIRIERMQPGEQQQASGQQQQGGNQQASNQQQRRQMQSGAQQGGQQQQASNQQQQGGQQQQASSQQQNQQQSGGQFDEQRVRQAFEIGAGQQQGQQGRMQQVAASELTGLAVYNSRGEQLGTADRVLQDPTQRDRHYLLMQTERSFGFENNQVMLPMERVSMQDNRLVVRGVTEEDLQVMQQTANAQSYPQAARNEVVNIGGAP